MIRRRNHPDGLPFRVYERVGSRVYSIGHKAADGTWSFRLSCPVGDMEQRGRLRREALRRLANLDVGGEPVDGSFGALADTWVKWQESLPAGAPGKRAATTLAENKAEIKALKRSFGPMQVTDIVKADGYAYLDACLVATDEHGNPRPRAAKGNKEIALASVIFEFGVRRRWMPANPFTGIEKIKTETQQRAVTPAEIALAVEVGRRMGGPQHIVAMGLRVAYLCVRRSVEVRAMTRDQIREEGIVWKGAKRQRGEGEKHGLIEWSPALREAVDEALAIPRGKLAGSFYVFGNLQGQRYTKSGWKTALAKLMRECVAEAEKRKVAFARFSLQDCRPAGSTEKMKRGDTDVLDALMHSSERMLRAHYDRRRVRVAKPTE